MRFNAAGAGRMSPSRFSPFRTSPGDRDVKRLTPAFLTMMMFGVVGLLIVAYIAKNLLAVEAKPPEPSEELLPMAIADIAAGTRLTEAHVGRGPYPKSRLEPDMLRTTRVIENRYTRHAIRAGQPIRANDLLPPGEMPALQVAEGMPPSPSRSATARRWWTA